MKKCLHLPLMAGKNAASPILNNDYNNNYMKKAAYTMNNDCFETIQTSRCITKHLGNLKKGILLFIVLISSFSCVNAGTVFLSQGSLDASTPGNWKTSGGVAAVAGDFTTAGNTFKIQSGHLMTTAASWTTSGVGTTVEILNGGQLTSTFAVATPNFIIDPGGKFIFAYVNGTAGATADIPGSTTRNFSTGTGTSNCGTVEIQAWGTGTSPVALPSGVTWGNLTINITTAFAAAWPQAGAITTINGDFTMTSLGSTARLFSFNANTPSTYSLSVGGNFSSAGGLCAITTGTSTGTHTISGNVSITGGTFDIGTGGGAQVCNVSGTFGVTTPGIFDVNNGSGGNTLNVTGLTTVTSGTFNVNAGGSATATFNARGGITVNGGTFAPCGSSSSIANINVTGDMSVTGGTTTVGSALSTYTITGNLNVSSGTFVTGSSSSSQCTTNVYGDINISSTGSMGASSSSSNTVTVLGNFNLSGSSATAFRMQNSSSTSKIYILNIGGNYNQTGTGTFIGGSSSSAGTINFIGGAPTAKFIQSAGTFTLTNTNIVVAANKTLILNNNIAIPTGRTFTINGGLDCGTNVVSGAGTCTISSGATLITANTAGITTSVATTTTSFSSAANYVFSGTSAQSINAFTTTPTATTVANLTICNSGAAVTPVSLAVTGTATVSGNINMGATILSGTGGAFTLAGNASLTPTATAITPTANGTVSSGATTIVLSSASGVVVGMNVSATGIPTNTYVTNIATNTITLSAATTASISTGSTITITSLSAIKLSSVTGVLVGMSVSGTSIPTNTYVSSISGNTIVLSNAATAAIVNGATITIAAAGEITTSSTSGIDGSVTVTGTKTFNNGTNYTFNGATTTPFSSSQSSSVTANNITLGANVTLQQTGSTVVATTVNGTLALGTSHVLTIGASNTLTINNALTQTTSTFTGSTTSSIVVGDAGSATNLTLPTVTNGLQNLTVNRSSGLTLGAALSIAGTLTFTSGNLTLSSNNLTLAAANAVAGSLNTSNHIIANSTGVISCTVANSASYTFPLGNSATIYNPVTISNTAGSSQTYTVKTAAISPAQSNALSYMWTIGGSTGTCNLVFGWNTVDAAGTLATSQTAGVAFSGSWTNQPSTTSSASATNYSTSVSSATLTNPANWTVGSPTCSNPNVTGLSVTGATNITSGSGSVVNISSSSLSSGTYTVTYNLSSPNAAIGSTASMSFTAGSPGAGTFTTSNLVTSGSTTVTVTGLASGACSSSVSSSNTASSTVSAGTANATLSTLTPVTASVVANGSSTQVLTVQAKDANGNNLTTGGSTVTITKSSGTGTIGSVTDNGNGTYTATVTSAASSGTGVFVATLGGSNVNSGGGSQTTSTISYTANPPDASQSTLTPTSTSITADGSSTQVLTVQAKDASGTNINVGGSTVAITKSSGTGTIGSVTDNGNGTYTATVTSPTATGSGVFVATLGGSNVNGGGGSQTTATITYTAGAANAAHSTLTPTSASITANGTSTQVLTVQARDVNNNNLTTGGATVTIIRSSGTGTISSVTDNGNGTYTATVTSPTATGSGVFAATLGGSTVNSGGGSQTTATITYTAGTATQVVITTSPTAPATNPGALAVQPVVKIEDANGNIVTSSSASVTISISGTNAAITAGTTTINASSGVATFSGIQIGTTDFSTQSATLTFASSGLTSAVSGSITIPPYSTSSNDYFRSNASSDWTTVGIWQSSPDNTNWYTATSAPTSAARGIDIRNGNIVGITSAVTIGVITTNVVAATIEGELDINLGGTLTIASGSSLTVTGTLNNTLTTASITTTGSLAFGTNGICQLSGNGGVIPAATWAASSTIKITGITSATSLATVNAPVGGNYGSLFVDIPGYTAAGPFKLWTNFPTTVTLAGDLTLGRTNGRILQMPTGTKGTTVNVSGNVNVYAGDWIINNFTTVTWTINGNLNIDATYSFGSSTGYSNPTFEVNTSSSTSTTVNLKGNLTMTTGANAGTGTTQTAVLFSSGSNTQNFNFTGTGNQTITNTGNGTFTGATNITVANTGTVPNNVVSLNGNFTVGGTLTLTSGTLVVGSNTLSLNGPSLVGSANLSLTSSSSLSFGGSSASVVIPSNVTSLTNLTIANATGVTSSSNIAISGIMSVTGTFIPASGNVISGSGTLSGTGTIKVTKASGSEDFLGQYTINTLTLSGLTVEFAGASTQGINANTFGSLKINNTNGVTAGGAISVNGTLTLTSGLLTTTSSNLLTLGSAAAVSGGSSSSYVNGPMQNTISVATSTSRVFPIGKLVTATNYYSPITLTVTQLAASATTYQAEAFIGGTTPSHSVPATLSVVSSNRYYTLLSSASNISAASISLNYDATDANGSSLSLVTAANIRIAGSSGWDDLGGTGTATGTGTIVSTTNFTTLGDFVIANALVLGAAPTLTAASGATVDGNINITFTDDPTWRAANPIVVKYGSNTLTAGTDYTLSAGVLTLKPSGSSGSGLRTPGTQTVTVSANSYNDATVSQTIAVGVPAKLVVKTQPAAPTTYGGTFATQPAIFIQDQYGNATTSTANVAVAVGAGSWALGGTTTVAAINGTATFSGLTATASTATSGSTLSFTSGSLTGTTSTTFTVPGPATYYWVGGTTSGNWITSAVWSTTKGGTGVVVSTPLASDTYIFDGTNIGAGATGNIAVALGASISVGQILIQNSQKVTFTPSTTITVTVSGMPNGADFVVGSGSKFTTAGSASTFALVTGATGSISDSVTFANGSVSSITVADAGALVVNSGAVMTFNLGSSSTFPFGQGTDGSVIFARGSKLLNIKAADPFGGTGHSIVVFQSGSSYELAQSNSAALIFSGRTFSNFIFSSTSTASPTAGSAGITFDSILISGTKSFTIAETGSLNHIKGNIKIGSAGGSLVFAPASASTFILDGTVTQTIADTGTLTIGANQTLQVNNSVGIIIGLPVTSAGPLSLSTGNVTLGSNNLTVASVTGGNSSSYIDASGTGKFSIASVPTSAIVFPIGTASYYAPLSLSGGTAGRKITTGVKGALTNAPASPNNVVNLEWSILASAATSPTVTFQYNSANQGSGYSSSSPVLGTYTSAFAESALGTVSGSNPYSISTSAAIALPISTASLYSIGNSHAFILTVPGAPTSVSATDGNAQASVTFTAPADNGGVAITSYTVTSSPGGKTGTGSASPITVTGLTNGTAYTLTVKANNSVGASAASSASNSVIPTSTTTWDGASWSLGTPTPVSTAVVSGNLTSIQWGAATSVSQLTINSGITFANTGTISITGASFVNNGTISGGTIVLAGTSNQTISGNGLVNSLTLNNNAGATISSGSNNLGITGILTLQSGLLTTNSNLTFKSTSIANTGVLAPYGASGNTGTISGTVTVERYIPAGFRAYRDIAPEVYNAGSMFKNWQENGVFTSGNGIFISGHNAIDASKTYYNAAQSGFDATSGIDNTLTGAASAYVYHQVSSAYIFDSIQNTKSTILNPFAGYRVLIRGDRSFNLESVNVPTYGTGATYASNLRMINATTLRATGQLITGTVTYSLTGVTNTGTGTDNTVTLNNTVNGFSLVANPYVAPVQWGTGTGTNSSTTTVFGASSNVNGSIWYLDPTSNAVGKYIAYNAQTGAAVSGYTSTSSVIGTGYIQPGQAVFVQTSATSPTVVFQETAKAISSTKTAVFGATSPLSKIYISLNKLNTSTNGYDRIDGAAIAFHEGFTNDAYGPQDALKFGNANDNLYITDKGKNLSIDGRLPATATDKLPIAISKVSGTSYQLQIDATNYTSNGFAPYLIDSYRGTISTFTNGTNTITFTADANVAATYSNRFSIAFKPTTLAVNSIVASATLNNNIATISWNTVGEKGVSRFEVEKSTDAKSFAKIGQATAKNTAAASYSITDNNTTTATSYYRVKAISEVGTVSYSNIVKLTTNHLPLTTIYPNPLVGKILTVSFGNISAGKYTLIITNVLGQKVQEVAISHAGGNGSHAISVNETMAAGTYSVTVRDANGQTVYQSNLAVQQ